jgi:hypothetical protein
MIAIQVSLYPLEQADINRSLKVFWKVLEEKNVDYRITPLSTITWGDDEKGLYNMIFDAYLKARKEGPAVLVSTLVTGDEERIKELLDFK